MDYNHALSFLDGYINYEKGFAKYHNNNYNPQTVGILWQKAGLDGSQIRFIHVAGTKGKGSTSFYLSALLRKLFPEERIGLYTSPHIERLNERIQINGHDIPDAEFAALVTRYHTFIQYEKPTYFEILTFLATAYFIEQGCWYAVLETGLGGRLDATNFCTPVLSVITSVAFDHTAVLGKTLRQIAAEKAGIIKRGVSVVTARQRKGALRVIQEKARAENAPIFCLSENVRYRIIERSPDGSLWEARITVGGRSYTLIHRLSQIGDVFIENLLLALLGLLVLFPDMPIGILEGFETRIPCRMEVVGSAIFDVAHNDSSFEALFKSVRDYLHQKRVDLYIGILADKELSRIADMVYRYRDLFQRIAVYDFPSPRPLGTKRLFSLLHKKVTDRPLTYYEDINQIVPSKDGFSVFCGSFYSITIAKRLFGGLR